MCRHAFSQLTARVEAGGVRLAFYFTTPVFWDRRDNQTIPPIRIQRKCVEGFKWGMDYAEHFDGMDHGEAKITSFWTLRVVM